MLNDLLSNFSKIGVVKRTISIDALVSILEFGMTDDIRRIVMAMIPNHWNPSTVVSLERVLHDDATIGASHVGPGRPSAKIVLVSFHFEFIPPDPDLLPREIPREEKLCSLAR